MKLSEIKQEPTPKGKRSLRTTVAGNINGYVSGKFWKTFGDAYAPWVEAEANEWLNGND
jgi:hypothetical protein